MSQENTNCLKCNKSFSNKYNLNRHSINCTDITSDNLICNICNKKYSSKYALKIHKNIVCVNIKSDTESTKHECNYCLKNYTSKFSLDRHQNICKTKCNQVDRLKNQIKQLEIIIQKQKKETFNDDKNDNIVRLSPFGSEDVNKLSPKERATICTSGANYLVECVKLLHFNDNRPEYKNISITNLRGNTGRIYIKSKWNEQKIDNILNNVIKNTNIKCKEMYNLPFPEDTKANKLEFTNDYIIGKENPSDPIAKRDEIKLVIYSNSIEKRFE